MHGSDMDAHFIIKILLMQICVYYGLDIHGTLKIHLTLVGLEQLYVRYHGTNYICTEPILKKNGGLKTALKVEMNK